MESLAGTLRRRVSCARADRKLGERVWKTIQARFFGGSPQIVIESGDGDGFSDSIMPLQSRRKMDGIVTS
jgi:hypothetical protein